MSASAQSSDKGQDLAVKACFACENGTPPLTAEEIAGYAPRVDPAWQVVDDKFIRREFKFKDFREAMVFVNQLADIANQEGHHPDLYIFYNVVRVELSTHAVKGLSENDFIMAAKIDRLNPKMSETPQNA